MLKSVFQAHSGSLASFRARYHQTQTGRLENIPRGFMPEFILRIENMHCGSCLRRVSRALASIKGLLVEEVRIGAARLSSAQIPAPVDQAIDALAKAGYPAQLET
jgi:copper chaperone